MGEELKNQKDQWERQEKRDIAAENLIHLRKTLVYVTKKLNRL